MYEIAMNGKNYKSNNIEKMKKMKWIHFKNVFSKRKLKTIQAIEYIKEGCLIRMSKKLEIEIEIIKKIKLGLS